MTMSFPRSTLVAACCLALAAPALTTNAAAQSTDAAASSSRVINGPLGPTLYGPGFDATREPVSDPSPRLDEGKLVSTRHIAGELYQVDVYSPSMDKVITNELLLPGGLENTTLRPSFYLLLGADGGRDGSWAERSNYEEFFAGKNVNVVAPVGSGGSMIADWQRDDPMLGRSKWATYMSRELPHVIDTEFHGSGRDAIAGVSMSGGAALNLAAKNPDRFVAAGSYSGCPSTLGYAGDFHVRASVAFRLGSPDNLWGPSGTQAWQDNSPAMHPELLRGTAVFVSAAHGTAGELDGADAAGSSRVIPVNPGEINAFACSSYFVSQARAAGVDVDFYEMAEGYHTWGQFEHQMRTSWRTIGPALGVQ